MAQKLTKLKLMEFLKRLGEESKTKGSCYLTGGTTAVLEGWRETTIDIDLKFDPEPKGVFEAIPRLKKELLVNVELAAPDHFIPALKNWKENSRAIGKFGNLEVFHYNFVAQALAKLERSHEKDLIDVRAMLERRMVSKESLLKGLEEIRPGLNRYPAIDEESFVKRVLAFLRENTSD